ncbi:MAG TPA: hypothetical protein DD727_01470 [Clostridiales bacterium]|nr:hypothetical protein [Clostridiales bacterium]
MKGDTHMKLTFTTFQIGQGLSLDELIDVARVSGCTGIEFRLTDSYRRGAEHANTGEKLGDYQHVYTHGVEISASAEQRRAIRRKMEDHYLEFTDIATGSMFHFTDPDERRRHIEGAREACRLAADLGCPRIRVFGNVIPEGVDAAECIGWVAESLAEVADTAAPLGVEVLLEMHGQFNYPGYALAVLKKADRPNIGLLYNCDPRDAVCGSVRETYSRVSPYIRHVHLHDLENGYPYLELFRLLLRDGYKGYVSAEIGASSEPQKYMKLYGACFRALRAAAELSL